MKLIVRVRSHELQRYCFAQQEEAQFLFEQAPTFLETCHGALVHV
jgi:hypothetical protein